MPHGHTIIDVRLRGVTTHDPSVPAAMKHCLKPVPLKILPAPNSTRDAPAEVCKLLLGVLSMLVWMSWSLRCHDATPWLQPPETQSCEESDPDRQVSLCKAEVLSCIPWLAMSITQIADWEYTTP